MRTQYANTNYLNKNKRKNLYKVSMFMTLYIVYSMYIELYMYVHYIIRRHSSMDVDVHVASIIKLLWGRINFSIIIHFVDFIFEANSDSINNCSLLGESSLKIIDSRLHLVQLLIHSPPPTYKCIPQQKTSLTSPYVFLYVGGGEWMRWGGE